jgi:hypothetical protein
MKPLKGLVYVAGPMTLGVREENITQAMRVGTILRGAGWAAFLPQLSYYWDDQFPASWEEWLDYDATIIERCVAVIRIPGESRGADREEAFAAELGVPVFYSAKEFIEAGDGLL